MPRQEASPRPGFNPRPLCPVPLVIQPEQRIEELKEFLQDPDPRMQRQRTNILGLIEMYETGKPGPLVLPGQERIWICEGKIMDPQPSLQDLPNIMLRSAVWSEVGLYLCCNCLFLTLLLGISLSDDAAEPSLGC